MTIKTDNQPNENTIYAKYTKILEIKANPIASKLVIVKKKA